MYQRNYNDSQNVAYKTWNKTNNNERKECSTVENDAIELVALINIINYN